ncbi:collagen alpha-6(VI) chain isoform X3 [Hydra vulgaris]|nr:collagen alpha-6(VI) chain isoform X2 [Hydra vulgaris]
MGSTTRIDKALRHSKNVMFTNQNGGRLEATKLLILLTDGAQTPSVEMEVPHIIADEIRQNGVSIIAIGIGEGINKTELSHIAGGDENTYNADTFEELKKFDFIKRIKEVVCSSVKRSLSDKEIKNNDNTEGRSFGMDVVFAMDVSSYSSNEMLREQKSLIRSLTSFFLPSQLNKLGLLTYSNKGVVKSELSSVFDSMVLDDIDNSFGLQRVDSAVEVASEMFLKQGSDNRMTRNRKKVLVLFVTSKRASTKPPFLSERSGKLLHSNDVRTVVIALDDIGEDFARNIPQAYFFKYFEDEYDKRVKDLLQYMHKQAKGRSFGMDVVFAMDVSSYSSNEMLHEQKSLVRSLTSFFLPSQLNKLGLLTYSDKGVVKSELSSVFDSKILDDIDNSVGSQRVDSAVEVAFEMFSKLSSENKMTRNREKVLILFVTSKKVSSKPPSLSERSGKLLHSNDVRTVVIALDDIGEDFTKNIPQAYFFKYFEEKTDKRVQDYFHNINALTSSPSLPISTSTIQSTNIFTQVSTQTFTTTEHHVQPSCEAIVDVAFILDSSGSLKTEYQKEKNFLKTLAAMFGISPNGSRVGVITFSFHAQLSIKLNSFSDLSSFNAAVDNIPLMGLTTRIDRALRLAQNEMFTLENGGRIGVTKLIILLTDGSQTSGGDAEDPDMIADELRKEGFVIIGVGIGSQVNQTELIHISGSQANAYSAATFDTLKDNDFIHKIKNSSCEIAKVQPSCQAVVDIGFILDSSGSLRKDYHKEKDFLKSLIAVFGLSANGSRAGVITFSYLTEHSIMLNSFSDLSSFNKAVDDIPLMGLTTRIDRALRLAQRKLFLSKHGGRKGVAKLLFVLTDGSQTPDADAEDPDMIADELRAMGVSIIGIGIGSEVNETELAHIAGGESNRYSASTFDKLKERTFLNNIKMSSCKIASDGFSNGSITDITDDKNDEQKTTLTPLITTLTSLPSLPTPTSTTQSTKGFTQVSTQTSTTTEHHVQPSCEAIVDVAFILDSSGSLKTEYQKEKNFLKTLAAMFGISPNGSRVGVITFSFHAQLSIKLNSFSDLSSFNAAVDNIPLMGLTTRIDRALRLAQNEMFTLENGGRIGVTKLIILLTDGSQTSGGDAEDPDMIADELRKEGFVIIGVGIGLQVNQTELIHISGSQANAYSAATFDSLKDNDFIHKIKTSSCEIAKVQPSCQAVVDIGFILDSSGSLRKDYHKEKDFLKSLIAVFGLSANGSRAGVITFSYHAEHSIMLNSFSDLSSFNKAVDDIPLMGLTTRIDRALRLAQRKLFLSKHGGRKGVAKLLFVLTDGSQTPDADAEDPDMIADELRAMGVSIIGIGIGSEVNETELAHIAGGESNRYSASTFDKLKERTFLNNIKMSSCKIASDGFSNGSITDITDDKNDEQKTTLAPLIATTKSFVFNQSCIKKTGLYTNASEGCFLKNMHLLDESIEFSNNLLLSGNFDESIVSFPKSYLETIFKYEKNLRKIIFELQPSLERLGLGSSCILHDDEEEKSNPFLLIKKSDILDKAREMGGGQFVDMLWATGLAKEILNSNKDITLIVPLSIRNIPDFIKRKMNNACLLRRMLNYHIVPGKQLLSSLKNNDVTISLYETNESINNNEFHESATLRGAVVKGFDIEVRGGVIHTVETFILPIEMDT